MAARDTSERCYYSVCYRLAEWFARIRRWMISSGIALRSRSATVKDYRFNSTVSSMPNKDMPLFRTVRGLDDL